MSERARRAAIGLGTVLTAVAALVVVGMTVSRVPYAGVDRVAESLDLRSVGEVVAEDRSGAWVFMGSGPYYNWQTAAPSSGSAASPSSLGATVEP